MKLYRSVLMLVFLPMGLCFAQSNQAVSTTGKPNRRQELYDQYHGITRKPISTTASAVAPVSSPVPVETSVESQQPAVDRPAPGTQATTTMTITIPQAEVYEVSKSAFRIGIRGGVTYPVYTDNRPFSTPGVGFVGGMTFSFGLGAISFQPEVNYARYTQKSNAGFGTSRVATDFIEVPLLIKLSTGIYAGNRFFITAGPYVRYASSGGINGKKMDFSTINGRLGYGAAIGIGTALKAGPGHVTVEVRGLYALGDTDNGFSTDSNTIQGQGTLGYMFPLSGR